MAITRIPLPIKGGAYTNVDEIDTGPYAPELVNGYIDEFGNTHSWPGLSVFCDLGTQQAVDGMYWWTTQNIAIFVSDGKIFKKTSSTSEDNYTDVTGTSTGIQVGTRVSFANYGSALYMANGGKIVKLGASTDAIDMVDGDAPTAVVRVEVMDTYLLALDTSGVVWFSDVAAPDTWVGEYFKPVVKPSVSEAMIVAFQEIYMIGEESLEVWRDDGVTPFVPNQNAYIESGTIAPYSFAVADSQLFYLDNKRQFSTINQRIPKSLSISMNRYIQDLSSVSDCQVDKLWIDGRAFLILSFPNDGKTLAYNLSIQDSAAWSRLTEWDEGTAAESRYRLNTAVYCPNWNLMLVGDYRNGKIYKLDTAYTDNDGDIIRWVRRTPHINHNTSFRKKAYGLHIRLTRSNVADAPPTMKVRFRDNGSTTWSNEISVPCGEQSDTSYIARIDGPLGAYVTRQYEFVVTDPVAFTLVDVEELSEASGV